MPASRYRSFLLLGAFLVIYIGWGTTYLANHFLLRELPPFEAYTDDWLADAAQDCGKILRRSDGIKEVLAGFGDSTAWLIAAAFIIADGFVITGLGRRIALLFLSRFGKTALGLAYGLGAADLVVSPGTPSLTARYVAEDLAVMYVGHMVEWGEVDEILHHPQHPYTQLLISAVPDPEKSIHAELEGGRKGEIPLWTPESCGCPFAGRCNQAMPRCKETLPPVSKLADNHFVRCYLYQ